MKSDCIKLGRHGIAAGLLAMMLAGCGGGDDDDARVDVAPRARIASAAPQLPAERGTSHVQSNPGQALLQCVPYARDHSTIKISGDAYTWWDKAAGKYERGANPATGAVMVLFNYAGSQRGHVAVVRRVVSGREIRIDHANWLDDGAIYVNDPVVDVSAANDWSQVRVWNIKTGGWGTRIYPVQGFIGSGSAGVPRGSDEDAPRGDNDDAPPNDLIVAGADAHDDDAAPVQRVAVAAPAPKRARAAPARTANPIVPLALGPDDRNPAPDSGFALTAEDLATP